MNPVIKCLPLRNNLIHSFFSFFLLQQIMKDRWINAGFEEDELKPYTEPELDITDQKRIGTGGIRGSLTSHQAQ